MKLLSVIGTRPEIIQCSAVYHRRPHFVVFTGQHFDHEMTRIFFDELDFRPSVNLQAGGGTNRHPGEMWQRLESILNRERPDWVLIYGDTDSTLAGAMAAGRLGLPVAHIEAGLRSFNRAMPEELNRVIVDHLATLHFCPTRAAVNNLAREGISQNVHLVDDVTIDAVMATGGDTEILDGLKLDRRGYILATIHRPYNLADNLPGILTALDKLDRPVVFPVHPHTRREMNGFKPENLRLINPVGYRDMLTLERYAAYIITDSGGVQKEAYALAVPCLTLRPETEWIETVETGWNRLVNIDNLKPFTAPAGHPPLFGGGRGGQQIVEILEQ